MATKKKVVTSKRKKKAKKKVGRKPYLVTDNVLEQAELYASRGMTQDQIAAALGISKSTYYDRKADTENNELDEVIRRGLAKGIVVISNAHYNAALRGNVQAQEYFLSRRAGWSETTKTELSGGIHVETGAKNRLLDLVNNIVSRKNKGDSE